MERLQEESGDRESSSGMNVLGYVAIGTVLAAYFVAEKLGDLLVENPVAKSVRAKVGNAVDIALDTLLEVMPPDQNALNSSPDDALSHETFQPSVPYQTRFGTQGRTRPVAVRNTGINRGK